MLIMCVQVAQEGQTVCVFRSKKKEKERFTIVTKTILIFVSQCQSRLFVGCFITSVSAFHIVRLKSGARRATISEQKGDFLPQNDGG